jgi:hypothetical protein
VISQRYFFAGAGVVLAPPEAGAAAAVPFVLAFFFRLCCALVGLCAVWLCAAGAAVLGFGCVAGAFPLFCASSPTAVSIEVKINFFICLLPYLGTLTHAFIMRRKRLVRDNLDERAFVAS